MSLAAYVKGFLGHFFMGFVFRENIFLRNISPYSKRKQ